MNPVVDRSLLIRAVSLACRLFSRTDRNMDDAIAMERLAKDFNGVFSMLRMERSVNGWALFPVPEAFGADHSKSPSTTSSS